MLTARPINATYTHVMQTNDSGRLEFEIDSPNLSLEESIPVQPLFTFSGVDGTWTTGYDGIGRFEFDPMSTSEFTLTMNLFEAQTIGTHYTSAVTINRVDQGFVGLGSTSLGMQEASVEPSGLASLVLTFTRGLADDAGDADPTTFGYQEGITFELEGEHVNAWLETGPSSIGDYEFELTKGFVTQTVTGLELHALDSIPEPSASALLALSFSGFLLRRRRN